MFKMRRVKIESQGHSYDTKIIDVETNQQITNVFEIQLKISPFKDGLLNYECILDKFKVDENGEMLINHSSENRHFEHEDEEVIVTSLNLTTNES